VEFFRLRCFIAFKHLGGIAGVTEADCTYSMSRMWRSRIVKDTKIGEFVCGERGLVIKGNILDRSPEWRAFTPQEKRARSLEPGDS